MTDPVSGDQISTVSFVAAGVYAVVAVAVLLVAYRAAVMSRREVAARARPVDDWQELHHRELAYLAGGPGRVLRVALVRLVDRGILDESLTVLRRPVAADRADRYERSLIECLATWDSPSYGDIERVCGPAVEDIRESLEAMGLAESTRTRRARERLWMIAARVVVAGGALLMVGSAAGLWYAYPVVVAVGLLAPIASLLSSRAAPSFRPGPLLRQAEIWVEQFGPAYRIDPGTHIHAYLVSVALHGDRLIEIAQPTLADQRLVRQAPDGTDSEQGQWIRLIRRLRGG